MLLFVALFWSDAICLLYLLFCLFSVSVHLKCLSEKGIVTRNDLAIWDKSIIKVREDVNINFIIILQHNN